MGKLLLKKCFIIIFTFNIFLCLQRSIKLFTIGLCLNSINGPNLENLRIMGVLQRFGIAYLICGVVHTIFTKKEYIEPQVDIKLKVNMFLSQLLNRSFF